LAARAAGGDRAALETLLTRQHDRLFAICRRLTGQDADADDATQDAMIAIARNINRFDGRSKFSTWAYRIAVNTSLDELRRQRRRPAPVDDVDLDRGPAPSHEAAVDARIDVDRALRGLLPEFRSAVVLRDLLGLDYAEIAAVLGIPPGTVRSRIARGRAALADQLGNRTPGAERPTP
jgi:RNA polymerase sigma-70 factor (ECF subfamily)